MGYSNKKRRINNSKKYNCSSVYTLLSRANRELIQSDNEKEFTNKTLNAYLEGIDVKHLYGIPYHPQSQGVIEAFNITVPSSLLEAYDNAKDKKMDWDLEMNLLHFLHFYDCKREHTSTGQILKRVLDNFNNEKIREIIMITT